MFFYHETDSRQNKILLSSGTRNFHTESSRLLAMNALRIIATYFLLIVRPVHAASTLISTKIDVMVATTIHSGPDGDKLAELLRRIDPSPSDPRSIGPQSLAKPCDVSQQERRGM